jgi:hypothetical protein
MIVSTKQGLCSTIELLGGPQISQSKLVTSFMKKHSSEKV